MSQLSEKTRNQVEKRLLVSTPARGRHLTPSMKEALHFALIFSWALASVSPIAWLAFAPKGPLSWIGAIGFVLSLCVSFFLFFKACPSLAFRLFGEWVLSQTACKEAVELIRKHEEIKAFVEKILASGREVRVADFMILDSMAKELCGQESDDWCKELHRVAKV